ncbi:MAG: CPBP family intramembrane metalloprotease [Alphaproteobacteria bacterium]|nr:CPBP family intramembrane metalloprotease [Alphaproteobacteria bacterium]
MRKLLISTGKILLFYGIWAGLLTASTLTVVHLGGSDFYKNLEWRTLVEAGAMLAVFIAFVFMALAVDRRGVGTLGLSLSALPDGLIGGTLIGAGIFCVPLAILLAQGYLHYAPNLATFSWPTLWLALFMMFVNVIDQELIVRSYLFQEIWAKYSGAAAVVVSTIIFVGLHAGPIMKGTAGLLAGTNVMLASILLGVAYLRSGALWLPIGIHFGWNAFQGPVLGINVTGTESGTSWHFFNVDGPSLWTGGDMGVEGGLAGLAGPIVGILLVLLLVRPKAAA